MTRQEPSPARLPAGPHGLTRDQVEASQRGRLLDATLIVVGEHGYLGASVAAITATARVSRSTFYQQFQDKQDAFLQSYDHFARHFVDHLFEVSGRASGPADAVASSVDLLVRWLSERPSEARAWLWEIHALGDAGLDRRRATMREVERAFGLAARWIRAEQPGLAPLAPYAARAVVAASFELLTDAVREPSSQGIDEICAAISAWWMIGLTAGGDTQGASHRHGPARG